MEQPIFSYIYESMIKKYSWQVAMIYGRLLLLSNKGEHECFLTNEAIIRFTGCSKNTMLKIVQTLVNEKLVFKNFDYSVKAQDRTKTRTFIINKEHEDFVRIFNQNEDEINKINDNDACLKIDMQAGANLNMQEKSNTSSILKNEHASMFKNEPASILNFKPASMFKNDPYIKNINKEINKEIEKESVHALQKIESESENLNKNNSDSESEKIETVEAEVLDNKKNSDEFNSFESVEKSESEKSNTLILPTKCKDFNKGRKPEPYTIETVKAYMEAFIQEHQAENPNLTCINTDFASKKFFTHYESVGWIQSRNPLKDWRAAVCKWLYRDIENPQKLKNSTQGKPTNEIYKGYFDYFKKQEQEKQKQLQQLQQRQQQQQQQQPLLAKEPF